MSFMFVEETVDESAAKKRPGSSSVPVHEFLAPVASLLKNADARKTDPSIKRTQVRLPLGMKTAPIYAVAGAFVGAFAQLNAERPEDTRYHTVAVVRCIASQYRPAGTREVESKKNPGVKVTKTVTEREASVICYLDPAALKKDLVHYHGSEYRTYRKVQDTLQAATSGTINTPEASASVTDADKLADKLDIERTPEQQLAAEQEAATKEPLSITTPGRKKSA